MSRRPRGGGSSDEDVTYAEAVGVRLRSARQRRGLSLQAVEALSSQEFKASVLGAYERGERSISVLRLQRLAQLYEVPVDILLPEPDRRGSAGVATGDGRSGPGELDARLGAIAARDPQLLSRYLEMIRAQRRTSEGPSISIRADDVRAIELLAGADAATTPAAGAGRRQA